MSTKMTKRKRAAKTALESPAPAPSTDVAVTNTIAAGGAEQASMRAALSTSSSVAIGDSLTTSSPVSTGDSLATLSPVVSLFSSSTVKDALALKGTLLQVLEAPNVTIDANSVERIDTAVIQMLCAFVRDRAARSLPVTWHGTPRPLVDAARLLGVGAMLSLPSQATEA